MVILLGFGREPLDATTRAKRIGELADSKNALAVQPRSFLVRQIGEEAEIVFLDRYFSAATLELALGAMPVQDKVRWSGGGQQGGDLADGLMDYARQRVGLYLEDRRTCPRG